MCKPTDCELWKIREGLKLMGQEGRRQFVQHVTVTCDHYSDIQDVLRFLDRLIAAKCPCDKGDADANS